MEIIHEWMNASWVLQVPSVQGTTVRIIIVAGVSDLTSRIGRVAITQ